MGFLLDDATYLAGALAILGGAFLVAVKISQQGKFLVWACVALGLAVLVLLVEWLWVTDAERIEQVVYDLRRATAASDAPAVLVHLTPDVQYGQSGQVIYSGESTRSHITSELERVKFDFIRITHLETTVSPQARRGTAEFRVLASGIYHVSAFTSPFGPANLDFSLGFREVEPGTWKVERINLTRAPRGMATPGRSR